MKSSSAISTQALDRNHVLRFERRYVLFCQKKQKNELLPPSSDSFLQHLRRVHYPTIISRMALTATQDVPQPESFGWVRDGRFLKPAYMTKAPAPSSLLELTINVHMQNWV